MTLWPHSKKKHLTPHWMHSLMNDKGEAEKILAVMNGLEALDYRSRLILLLVIILLGINIVMVVWQLAF